MTLSIVYLLILRGGGSGYAVSKTDPHVLRLLRIRKHLVPVGPVIHGVQHLLYGTHESHLNSFIQCAVVCIFAHVDG